MEGIEKYIPHVAQWLGVEPSTVLLIIGVTVALSNLAGRLIPDDKVGVLGVIRTVAKFVGLYASNRISSGLTVNAVARSTAPVVETINEQLEQVEERLDSLKVTKAFPGLPERDPATGKFLKKDSE